MDENVKIYDKVIQYSSEIMDLIELYATKYAMPAGEQKGVIKAIITKAIYLVEL